MRLTISDVRSTDYGVYMCLAKNPRGETDGTIRLYCKYMTKTIALVSIIFQKEVQIVVVKDYVPHTQKTKSIYLLST